MRSLWVIFGEWVLQGEYDELYEKQKEFKIYLVEAKIRKSLRCDFM